MPKRKYNDDKEEKWRKKMRKYERKLRNHFHEKSPCEG